MICPEPWTFFGGSRGRHTTESVAKMWSIHLHMDEVGVADPSMNWHPLTKNHRLNVYECLWIRVICTKVVYTYIYSYLFTCLHVYILICLFNLFLKWICRDIECASTNIRLDHACIHLYTSISQHIHKRTFFFFWRIIWPLGIRTYTWRIPHEALR